MHIDARPFRLPSEAYPAQLPGTGFLRSLLAYAVVALLTLGGVLLLSAHGIAIPAVG